MGLDITAYSKLTQSSAIWDREEGHALHPGTNQVVEKAILININPDFPGRNEPLKPEFVYEYDKDFRFQAGSYSGYNRWREWLAELSGQDLSGDWPTSGPFWELINFSDCEGIIGTDACIRLKKDFDDFAEQAKAKSPDHSWFWKSYQEWQAALELAADGGCLDFH